MILAENKTGHQLLEYINISEDDLIKNKVFEPITGAFAFIKCKDKYLITYNKWRKQWEFPAGKIEKGESYKECAARELMEETNQKIEKLEFKGLFKIYDKNKSEIRYRAIYFGELDNLEEFKENDETNEIMLWDLKSDIGYFDEVDKKMIQLSLEKIKDTCEFSKPYIDIPEQYLDLLNKYNHYIKEDTSINLKYELNNNKVLSYLADIGISTENKHNLETIKELLKQLCLKIKHDGINYWHGSKYGTINTFEFALAQNSFTNCRGLAIIFCGILRAYGFKSSYITCMPYDIDDTECHVVCEVYVEELKKFIFIDPSYQVYFTHKNKILNLIEFRECVKNNEDISYYEGASYNGQKFDLLSYLGYFSKNIFYFEKCIDNCEDKESTKDNSLCLVPMEYKEIIKYEYTHISSNINDYYQV